MNIGSAQYSPAECAVLVDSSRCFLEAPATVTKDFFSLEEIRSNMNTKALLRSVATCPAQPFPGSYYPPVLLCHILLDNIIPVCFSAPLDRVNTPTGGNGVWDCGFGCPWIEYFTLPVGPFCGDNTLIVNPCSSFAPGVIAEFNEFNHATFDGLTLGTYHDGPLWTLDTTTFAPFNAIHYLYPPVPGFIFTTELFIVCGVSNGYVTNQTPDFNYHIIIYTNDPYVCSVLQGL